MERAERDAARAAERAARDEQRYFEDRAEILERNLDDPARQERDLARLEEDRSENIARAAEEAAEIAAELQEELADIDADAAEDAAERAEDADRYGDSTDMRQLAAEERPEYDDRGYPVRRGEIVALGLTGDDFEQLGELGFAEIERQELAALDTTVHRLRAPDGMEAGAALARAREARPDATFDYVHYYGMQYSPSGEGDGVEEVTLPQRRGDLTIGMIDTGVIGHPALRRAEFEIADFGRGASVVPTAHGTAVASILASEGASEIYVANIFRGTGDTPYTSADSIVEALNWMVSNRVPVVNMSLSGPRNAILDRLIAQTIGRGTLIVAAAGNGGPTAAPAYPAALEPVVAVTAVDDNERVYRYANQGRYITVAALGVGQPAANTRGGISRFNGTSFATPHISAWLARCLDRSSASSCARSLRREARDLGAPGYDPVYGYGLIE